MAEYTFVRLGRGTVVHWGEPGRARMLCGQAAGGSRQHGVTSRAYGATAVTCERCHAVLQRRLACISAKLFGEVV